MEDVHNSFIYKWLSEVEESSGLDVRQFQPGYMRTLAPVHEGTDDRQQGWVHAQDHTRVEVLCEPSRKRNRETSKERQRSDQIMEETRDDPFNRNDGHNLQSFFLAARAEKNKFRKSMKCSPGERRSNARQVPHSKDQRVVTNCCAIRTAAVDREMQNSSQQVLLEGTTNKRTKAMEKTYERKPRHKTRQDRYEPKGVERQKARKSTSNQHRNKHPKRKDRRHNLISEGFKAANVTGNRLTLNSSHKMGIFGKGKTSSPVKSRDLPDLTFSEMKFLHKHADENDNGDSRAERTHNGRMSPERRAHKEISRSFLHTSSHVDNGGGGGMPRSVAPAIHHPVSMPSSHQQGLSTLSIGLQTFPSQVHYTDCATGQRLEISPGSATPYTWSESEQGNEEELLDPSLETYVRGLLLDSLYSGNGKCYNSCEESKIYYDLDDLKRLCKERECMRNLESGDLKNDNVRTNLQGSHDHILTKNFSSVNTPAGDQRIIRGKDHVLAAPDQSPGKDYQGKTLSSREPPESTVSAVHQNINFGYPERPFQRSKPSNQYISPMDEQDAKPSHLEQRTAYRDRHMGPIRHPIDLKVDADYEGAGEHQEGASSIDLQTEYAIGASMSSVEETLFNLFGEPISVEELLEIEEKSGVAGWPVDRHYGNGMHSEETSKQMRKQSPGVSADLSPRLNLYIPGQHGPTCFSEAPNELLSSSAPYRRVDHSVQDESQDDIHLAGDFPSLTKFASNFGAQDSDGVNRIRLSVPAERFHPSDRQLPAWVPTPSSMDRFSGQTRLERYGVVWNPSPLKQVDYSEARDLTGESDHGPRGFWQQNKLY